MGTNPTVIFLTNPEIHTAWKLRLTPPSNRSAVVNAPDSPGWSLGTGGSQGRSGITIGCDSNPAYADVVWVGPEEQYPFHTTLRGTLSSCGNGEGGSGGGEGRSPAFDMDLRGEKLVITATPEDTMVGEVLNLTAEYVRPSEGQEYRRPVEVLWESSSQDLLFIDQNGYFVSGTDTPRQSIQAVSLHHGEVTVSVILEEGRVSLPIRVYAFAFRDDQDAAYNFSPTMGEVAKLKYELLPAVELNTQVPGLLYEIAIVRELQNGDDQLVDEVNLDPNIIFKPRHELDLTAPKVTEWNGIPKPLTFGGGNVGNTIPQSTGGGAPFQGVNAQFQRILPEIHVNQPVPPPLYTARLVVTRHKEIGQPRVPVYETRENVFVPQVFLLKYEDDISRNAVMDEIIIPKDKHNWPHDVLIYRTSLQTFDFFLNDKIARIRQAFSGVNIRFTYDQSQLVGTGYGTVRYWHNPDPYATAWGTAPAQEEQRFGNPRPTVSVNVYNKNIRGSLNWEYVEYGLNFYDANPHLPEPTDLPLVPFIQYDLTNMSYAVAHTTVHEVGHALGLVAPGNVLDGWPLSAGKLAWHNQGPYYVNHYHIMDPGQKPAGKRFDPTTGMQWRPLNFKYLEYILPQN